MSHPLECTWSLYVTRNKRRPGPEASVKDWEDRLAKIGDFNSIEEFWGVYNNLRTPTELNGRGDYFLFKQGIHPEWEDPRNSEGGAWSYSTSFPEAVNDMWLNTLLALIGYQFAEDMERVCGVEMSVRTKKYRLSLWTDSTEEPRALGVGRQLRELLGNFPLEFKKHDSEQVLFRI